MKYVTEFILLGQATEIRSRVISRLVCAILPTWRNARLKPYARYYPPLPYTAFPSAPLFTEEPLRVSILLMHFDESVNLRGKIEVQLSVVEFSENQFAVRNTAIILGGLWPRDCGESP